MRFGKGREKFFRCRVIALFNGCFGLGDFRRQRIDLDLSPPPGMQGQAPPVMLRILSPEEAAKAMQSPADLAQVQQQEQQKVATQGPSETP